MTNAEYTARNAARAIAANAAFRELQARQHAALASIPPIDRKPAQPTARITLVALIVALVFALGSALFAQLNKAADVITLPAQAVHAVVSIAQDVRLSNAVAQREINRRARLGLKA